MLTTIIPRAVICKSVWLQCQFTKHGCTIWQRCFRQCEVFWDLFILRQTGCCDDQSVVCLSLIKAEMIQRPERICWQRKDNSPFAVYRVQGIFQVKTKETHFLASFPGRVYGNMKLVCKFLCRGWRKTMWELILLGNVHCSWILNDCVDPLMVQVLLC